MTKGLEALRRTRLDVSRGNCEYNVSDYLDTIEKELKALEIIKEKSVLIECLMDAITLGDYNCQVMSWNKLSKEEFDLLKEVLENDNHSRV